MSIVSGVFTYLMIWWIALFVVLPFSNAPLEHPEPGHATSAPANPRIKQKLIWTSVLALVIWLAVFALIQSNLLSFHEMVKDIPD